MCCDTIGLLMEGPKVASSNLLPVPTHVMIGTRKERTTFANHCKTPDGPRHATRDFIHVADLARGHVAALSTFRDKRIKIPYGP